MLAIVVTLNDIDVKELQKKTGNVGLIAKKAGREELGVIDQFLVLFHSIQKNWKIPHQVYLMHSKPLSSETYDRLLGKGIRIIHREVPPKYKLPYYYNRLTAFFEKLDCGTHRLILDADMIATAPLPPLNMDCDAQVSYSGYNVLSEQEWRYLCSYLKIEMPWGEVTRAPFSPFREHQLGSNTAFFPCLNVGATLLKHSFSLLIADRIARTINKIQHPSCKLPDAIKKKFAYMIASSLTIIANTNDWWLFPRGFNFLGSVIHPSEFSGTVSLYHYLGSKPDTNIETIYKQYFDVLRR